MVSGAKPQLWNDIERGLEDPGMTCGLCSMHSNKLEWSGFRNETTFVELIHVFDLIYFYIDKRETNHPILVDELD